MCTQEQFLAALANGLADDEAPSEELLKEAFLESVSALPPCKLKSELLSDIDRAYENLKTLLRSLSRRADNVKTERKGLAQDSSSSLVEEKSPRWTISALTSEGLETTLEELRGVEYSSAKIETYLCLAMAGLNFEDLRSVLSTWSKDIVRHDHVSLLSESLAALRFLPACAANSKDSLLCVCEFCLRAYSEVAEQVAASAPSSERGREHLRYIKASIFSLLMVLHQRKRLLMSCLKDVLAALVSLYADVTLMALQTRGCDEKVDGIADHLWTVLQIFLLGGHCTELCVEALLQTTCMPSPASSPILLQLIRRILVAGVHQGYMKSLHYTKCLCLVHRARKHAEALGQDFLSLQQLAFQLPVPTDFQHWLFVKNSRIACDIGLKQTPSLVKTAKGIIRNMTDHQANALLDVATSTLSNVGTKEKQTVTGSPPLREQKDAEQELELFTAGDFFVEDRAPTSEVDSLLFADDDSEKVEIENAGSPHRCEIENSDILKTPDLAENSAVDVTCRKQSVRDSPILLRSTVKRKKRAAIESSHIGSATEGIGNSESLKTPALAEKSTATVPLPWRKHSLRNSPVLLRSTVKRRKRAIDATEGTGDPTTPDSEKPVHCTRTAEL